MTFPGGPAAAAGLAQAAASGQTTAFAAAAASAQAAASGLAAPAEADARAPAAVLGLDAEEVTVGARLTRALRTAFAARGLGGGQEAGLPELRLALGCASNEPACLVGGGDMLGARRLIYGGLHEVEAGRWTLELSILEVESARVTGQLILALAGSDLTPARIDATAEDVVTRLLPDELDPTRPDAAGSLGEPPPPPSSEIDPGVEPEPAPPVEERHRRLVWGYQRPTPRWKWAGFGASAGLSVVGIAVVVGTAVYLQRGFREDLEAAASATLDKPEFNQVPLTLPAYVSLCDYNRYHYDVVSNTYIRGAQIIGSNGVPGARDQGVAEVCTRGENVKTTNTAALVVTGVSLVSTAVFTTLLFVHRAAREPSRATARAWSRRGLRVDLSPAVGRGATLGVHGRF